VDIYIIQDFSLWFYYFLGVAFNFILLLFFYFLVLYVLSHMIFILF